MLKAAMIFSDKMVLQREKEIPVWGEATPGARVAVELDGNQAHTHADENGNWMVKLPPHEAGCGYSLRIAGEQEEISFSDVCVGEVWLAGGQSNMEFLIAFEAHVNAVLGSDSNPMIRFFDYPEVAYEGQLEDCEYRNDGFWRNCSKNDLPWFSAVGYYFARNLQAALHVPVGIVGCSWGGTPACTWMDPAYLEGNEGEIWLTEYMNGIRDLDVEAYKAKFRANPGNYKTNRLGAPLGIKIMKDGLTLEEQKQMLAETLEPSNPAGPWWEGRPGGLYETMLKKIHPYAIRGVIWYQGESDDKHPREYKTVFSQLIRCWRDLWQEELPFLFVQLAPFHWWLGCEGRNYPMIRESQKQVSGLVPNTWMASIGDAGMEWDIHPKDKAPVGNRLALLARGHVYGESILCDAPAFQSAQKAGNCIEVCFAYGDGLEIVGDDLQAMIGVNAAGESRALSRAAVADGKLILLDCGDIVTLQFAWTDYYEINLYNAAGIPATPFEVML